MTADWETKLLQIERGEMEPETFMTEINAMIPAGKEHGDDKRSECAYEKQNYWCLSELRCKCCGA